MPADFESGFFYRTPAWHREGDVYETYPADWSDARQRAGLTWEPRLVPVYRHIEVAPGEGTYIDSDGRCILAEEVPDTKLIERDDNGAVLARGVSDDYALIDHSEMGAIAEALLEVGGNTLKIDALMSLRGGKSVAAVLQLDEPFSVPGDPSEVRPLLALHNHHDGEGGCKAISTTLRTVCANTFSANEAHAERSGTFFTFRHRGDWKDRIAEARTALTGVRTETSRFRDVANDLAALGIVERHVGLFLSEFIPMPPKGLITERVAANVEKARADFRELLASPTCEGVRDTAWGLVQAATEYLDHVRPARSKATLMGRSVLRPEPLKAKAVTLVREVVGAAS